MKGCLTIILSFAFLIGSNVQAQIVLDDQDMPIAGDIIPVTVTAALPEGVDPALTGEGFTWDYSDLEPGISDIDTFFTVSQTPLLYQFYFNNQLFYPDHHADHARKEMSVNLGLVNITDAYSYFKSDAMGYRNVGFGASVNGLPSSVRNVPIDWIYEFPLAFGDESSSSSASELVIPTLGYYHHEQDREVIVEGWGTLILPDESYEVLKVKMIIEAQDSVYIESFGTGFAIDQPQEVIYQWLAVGEKAPLLEISQQEGFGYTVRYRYSEAVSVEEVQDIGISIYPNPVQEILTLKTGGRTLESYAIFDVMGKQVLKKQIGYSTMDQTIPVHNFAKGEYFLLMQVEGASYYSAFLKD